MRDARQRLALAGILVALASPAPAAAHARACELIPREPRAGEWFGFALAADGKRLAVGAPGDPSALQGRGTVYVFQRDGASWGEGVPVQSGAAGDRFGVSVALRGDHLAVGATAGNAVFLFRQSGNGWVPESPPRLAPPNGGRGDDFGFAVALSDDTLAVGAPGDGDRGSLAGAVYVFQRSGAGWSLRQKLLADDSQAADRFGSAVALDGDTLVVGAPFADDLLHRLNFGRAYVFERKNGTWTLLQKKLTAGEFAEDDAQFSAALALSHGRLVAGAPGEDRDGPENRGAAYVFTSGATGWTPSPDPKPYTDRGKDDRFGSAVATDGTTDVIGAPFHTSLGAAFVGDEPEPFTGQGASKGSRFGGAVALMDDVVLIGGSRDDPGGAVDAGAVAFCDIGSPQPCGQLPTISKAGPAGAVVPGPISYTVVVANGTAPQEARVTDLLDSRLGSVLWCRAEGDGVCTPVSHTPRDIDETIPLSSGARLTYRVNAQLAVGSTGELVNRACVSVPGCPGLGESCSTVRNPIGGIGGVDLRVTGTATPSPVVKGRLLTIRWVVKNVGAVRATGVRLLTVPEPPPLPRLDPGDTWETEVSFAVPACYDGPNPIERQAEVQAANGPDVHPEDNVATVESRVLDGTADVAVAKRIFDSTGALLPPAAKVAPGDQLTYRITVEDLGPDPACGVVLRDQFPAGLVPVPPIPDPCLLAGQCPLGELAKNTPRTLEATFEVGPEAACPGSLKNIASVTSSGSIDRNRENDSSEAMVKVDAVDLAITKEGPTTATAGDPLLYTVRVRNKGCVIKAHVTDAFPAELLQAHWCEGAGCTPSLPGPLDRTLSLAPGAGQEFRIQGTVSPLFAGTLTNTAKVEPPAGVADDHPEDNEATVKTDVVQPPGFHLFCSGIDGPFAEGDMITCTFTLLNGGPTAQADNAGDEFSVTLPAGLTLVSASADSPTVTTFGNTVFWNGAVPVGGRVEINVTATVNAGTAGTTICIQGSAFLDTDGDGVNDTVFLSDTVDPPGPPADPCCFRVLTAEEIPALSDLGAAVLVLLLAAAALARLRITPPPV
jgi:uncharacterized repeat protein (TIGR01451 family)